MANSSSGSASSGTSISGLLGVLFVGLKLTGFIDWPWLWVLSPFWIPLVIVLGVLAVLGIIWLIASFVK
jgi:hypothetical protein